MKKMTTSQPGSQSTWYCFCRHLPLQERSLLAILVAEATKMASTARTCSPFVRTTLNAPRLRARITCVRAGQLKRSQHAQPSQVQDLKVDGTYLTGIAGLLVPLVMDSPAFAATPEGEHLTKVCCTSSCGRYVRTRAVLWSRLI